MLFWVSDMFTLPEKITVWNAATEDGLGGKTWSGPFVYPARIAFTQKKFTDKNGDSKMSTAVCYSKGAGLLIGAMVLFGESTDAAPPSSANDVRALSQTPSGAGDLKKAWFA